MVNLQRRINKKRKYFLVLSYVEETFFQVEIHKTTSWLCLKTSQVKYAFKNNKIKNNMNSFFSESKNILKMTFLLEMMFYEYSILLTTNWKSNGTMVNYQFIRGSEFLISYQGVLITFSTAESMLTTVYCCRVLTFYL